MKYISVCSGIEAASVAWHSLGFQPVAFSEIEPFPCSVLAHHYPHVPNHGDMTKFKSWPDYAIDLLVGGTPCQAFSVAGLRKGLADPRGNLTLVFLGIVERYRPRWVVWENVPGVLSDKSNAFGHFLAGLAELGYGCAYRVLDAQFFGVAQRRRRVFVVGHLGAWQPAAAVLFEPESLRGDSAPRREAREATAPTLAARTRGGGGLGTDAELDGALLATEVAPAVTSKWAKGSGGPSGDECQNLVAHTLRAEGHDASEDGTGRGTPLVATAFAATDYKDGAFEQVEQAGPLTTSADHTRSAPVVAFNMHKSGNEGSSLGVSEDRTDCLRAFEKSPFAVMPTASAVRRLTPRECERLQGFPDDWTLVPHRNKPAADGPRYKALGNSMAVPVMRWIGERIAQVDKIITAP